MHAKFQLFRFLESQVNGYRMYIREKNIHIYLAFFFCNMKKYIFHLFIYYKPIYQLSY